MFSSAWIRGKLGKQEVADIRHTSRPINGTYLVLCVVSQSTIIIYYSRSTEGESVQIFLYFFQVYSHDCAQLKLQLRSTVWIRQELSPKTAKINHKSCFFVHSRMQFCRSNCYSPFVFLFFNGVLLLWSFESKCRRFDVGGCLIKFNDLHAYMELSLIYIP